MAAPLQALRDGHSAWAVGVLLALFAAGADRASRCRPAAWPTATATTGRCASRSALCVGRRPGVACAVAALRSRCASPPLLTGAGANIGMITIQRSAGRLASERDRAHARLQLARPRAGAGQRGRLGARRRADRPAGFRAAFGAADAAAAGGAGVGALRVPRRPRARRAARTRRAAPPGTCCARRRLRRLLLVNWLLSASWDVHSFVVPMLGHERGISASAIGIVLGLFAARGRRGAPGRAAARAPAARDARCWSARCCARPRCFGVYPFVHAVVADGGVRRAARPRARLGAADDHDHAAPDHAARSPRRGDRAALDDDQLRRAPRCRCCSASVGAALGAGALFWVMGGGGRRRQPAGAPASEATAGSEADAGVRCAAAARPAPRRRPARGGFGAAASRFDAASASAAANW